MFDLLIVILFDTVDVKCIENTLFINLHGLHVGGAGDAFITF